MHTEENICHLSLLEEDPTQIKLCIEPTTLCSSPTTEVRSKYFSIIVSEGRKDSKSSQSSGSSMPSQNHLVLLGKYIMQNMMVGVDPTLRMLAFHGEGTKDPEKHLLICDTIWTVNIVQLEMTFRDHALLWYMKYQIMTLAGQTRTLAEVRKDLLKEFQKPKSKSQCITELKEIKKIMNELVWDYDQIFKILKDRLTFQIPYEQHRE
jgi:hypothetical protein